MKIRASNVGGRLGSTRFWTGLVLVVVTGYLVFGQFGIFARNARSADNESSARVVGAASGQLLTVALAAHPDGADPLLASIAEAKRLIAKAKDKYKSIQDYSCDFHKRERIGGRLHRPHIMSMKSRTNPESIYFKFQQPNKGREAIYVEGKHDGRMLAHDVGLGKFLAGTIWLDPRGSMAMAENRHPVTDAGIGNLIDTVYERWEIEMSPEASEVTIDTDTMVEGRACTMVDSTHPDRRPDFFFHKVRVFFDDEHGLPIRFEAYDWPETEGADPELLEEYTYTNLKTDLGLTDLDFDSKNPAYSFGRF